jgi:ElaB/YqjD/DUF883 family membrane-anchored ribosome-binding protein
MTNEAMPDGTENGKNGTPDVITTVREGAHKLGAQAAEVGGKVYGQAVDAGRYAGRQIEEQPWVAAVATGLVGLAIGILIGRASVPVPTARDYVDEYLPRRLRRK